MNILRNFLIAVVFMSPFVAYAKIDLNNVEEVDLDDELDDFGDLIDHAPTRSSYTPVDALSLLMGFKANEILALDFYKETYRLEHRPINSFPIFLNRHNDQLYQNWTFNLQLLYNQCDKMYFTKNSAAIKDYLNIGLETNFIRKLREALEPFDTVLPYDVPKTIGLFSGAKVQERRAGLLFQLFKSYGKFTFEISTPLIYQERNYFLNDQEQKNVRDTFGESSEKETIKFVRDHLVADRLGFDDTRIKLSCQFAERSKFCGRAGGQFTLPTAVAFKKGLYGTNFRKHTDERPTLDLNEIVSVIAESTSTQQEKETEMTKLKDLGVSAIDWMSAILLDEKLGNGGHFGLGGFIESSFKIAKNVDFNVISSIEYLCPKTVERYFIKKKNPALFEEDIFNDAIADDDEAEAARLIKFLSDQTIETFFPEKYKTTILPGFMFQFTIGPNITVKDWNFQLGYDFWFKQRGKIEQIFNVPSEGLVKNERPSCFQNKLFASVRFNKIRDNYDWAVSLNAGDTISSSGIGKDFTASLGFHINF